MMIYRVEHMSLMYEGRPAGPYQSAPWSEIEHADNFCYGDDCVHAWIDNLCSNISKNRPGPWSDGVACSLTRDHLFGFWSTDALRDWFTGDIRMLNELGFVVAAYEAEQYLHGGHQSIFLWDTAERVAEYSLMNLPR